MTLVSSIADQITRSTSITRLEIRGVCGDLWMWPSWGGAAFAASLALEALGVDPHQDVAPVLDLVRVMVTPAGFGLKSDCQGLLRSVLRRMVGVLDPLQSAGPAPVWLPAQFGFFTVEFQKRRRRRLASVLYHHPDDCSVRKILIDIGTPEASDRSAVWKTYEPRLYGQVAKRLIAREKVRSVPATANALEFPGVLAASQELHQGGGPAGDQRAPGGGVSPIHGADHASQTSSVN